jgi:phage shock protein PspC (stress-responsive transcriptional regulator)
MVAVNDVPVPTTRVRDGRWLGGVCVGLAARWGVPVGRVRLGFLLGSLLLGLGALVYIAAWLILPEDGVDGRQRGIVLVAQAIGALLGLAALCALGGAATVFGYGWVVFALGCLVLVGVLAGWARLGPAWALLPIGALVLPSVAMAVGGVRIDPSTSARIVAPRTLAELPKGPLRSGLGLLTIDLRHTALPTTGTIPLRIEAGPRRTLIALPHDRCVNVVVNQYGQPRALRLALGFIDRYGLRTPQLFGSSQFQTSRGDRKAPVLEIDFTSVGGSLVVRDYPDDVDPTSRPDWPGYSGYVEPQPDTSNVARAEARTIIRAWRARRKAQDRIDRLMDGPCARTR